MPYADPERKREYQRYWYAARRAEWLEGKSCVDCGTAEGLQVDHVDASQKVSHRVWSWSLERRQAELAKCVARCAPCHRRKTLACGEHARGERIHGAHSAALVLAVRARRDTSGVSYRQLAREFKLPVMTVWDMCNLNWKHLDAPAPAAA